MSADPLFADFKTNHETPSRGPGRSPGAMPTGVATQLSSRALVPAASAPAVVAGAGEPHQAPSSTSDDGRAAYVAIKAMNWSTLKHMDVSPKFFKWRLENPVEDKPAFAFGRAIHCALLEPEVFAATYIVAPDFGNLRTKAARAERDAWHAEHVHVEVVSEDELAAIKAMTAAIDSHKIAGPIVRVARPEQTITWTDAETGVACKARLDLLGPTYLADVKSTRNLKPRDFLRDVAKYLNHAQFAFYHDGAIASGALPSDATYPYVIAAENVEPHDVVIYRTHLFALEAGRKVYRKLLARLLECEAAGWWPGMAPGLMSLGLPDYAPGMESDDEPDPDATWRKP